MRNLCLTVFAFEFKGQSKFCLSSGIPSVVGWERFDSGREVGTSTGLDAYKHCGLAFGDSCPCQTTTRQEELGGGAWNLVKRDAEDGLVNQIDIYIFSRLCDGWWSDSYGKGRESSADKSQKLQRRMMEFGQFACRGDLDTILCPWCNILRACIGTGSSPIQDIQGDFYSLDLTIRIQNSYNKLEKMVQRQIREGLLKVALFIQISMPMLQVDLATLHCIRWQVNLRATRKWHLFNMKGALD